MSLDLDKPHRGTITNWRAMPGGLDSVVGSTILGEMAGSTLGIVSGTVRAQEGNEIETLNWRYTLGKPQRS